MIFLKGSYTRMASTQFFRGFNTVSQPKVCIIGSGPAGFYLAQHLFKVLPNSTIDMYEKLPVPFGLVRYGVAPDHPEVKNVINRFTKTATSKNFNFYGNVSLGIDVSFNDFKQAYHAIVLSYGCSEDKKLGIKGEDNIISARRFVGWYNGLPEDKDLNVDLSDCESCTIIGQGNVAVDVARIILTPIDILKKTDITSYSLEALSRSRVRKVWLVGRRGPLQVAFTIKEMREMTRLPEVSTLFEADHLVGLHQYLPQLERPRKRLTELILNASSTYQHGEKYFCPLFFRKPHECSNKSITFRKTALKDNLKGLVEDTDLYEEVPSLLTIASVGYRGVPADPDLPFHHSSGTVISQTGIYACGWIGTGPVGVILATMNNAFQEAARIASDIQSGKVNVSQSKPGYEHIKTILISKGINVVNFEGWKKIDKVEIEKGEKVGKPREKIVDVKEMLDIGGEGI